jgi:hypothetical protein
VKYQRTISCTRRAVLGTRTTTRTTLQYHHHNQHGARNRRHDEPLVLAKSRNPPSDVQAGTKVLRWRGCGGEAVSDGLGGFSIADVKNPGEFVLEHDENVAQMDQLLSSPSFFHTHPLSSSIAIPSSTPRHAITAMAGSTTLSCWQPPRRNHPTHILPLHGPRSMGRPATTSPTKASSPTKRPSSPRPIYERPHHTLASLRLRMVFPTPLYHSANESSLR